MLTLLSGESWAEIYAKCSCAAEETSTQNARPAPPEPTFLIGNNQVSRRLAPLVLSTVPFTSEHSANFLYIFMEDLKMSVNVRH